MAARVREAKPSDKAQLMSFIKDIWEGHDYIPYVWDEWLNDESGRMSVVEVEGVPVGMNRVRFLEDGSAWFEGVRIHPGFRGKGLASMLGENSMEVARKRGVTRFRLTSGSRNRSAHRQIARIGFKESSRITVYEPKRGARFRHFPGVHRAGTDELPRVRQLIRGSREFRLGSGVFWDSFTAAYLSPSVIEKLVKEGSVWVSEDAVLVTRMAKEGREVWRQVCFMGGGADGGAKLVSHVLGLKGRPKATRKLVFLPQGSRMVGVVRRIGLTRMAGLILFERGANG